MNIFKKRQIMLSEVQRCCAQIADAMKSFQPEHIVSIESGGWYIGHLLEKNLLISHHSVVIRRLIHPEKLHRKFPLQLRCIPMVWQGVLFFFKNPILQEKLPDPIESVLAGKRVLLVDDAVHSGKTVSVAIEYLQSIGVAHIKTAVIGNVYNDPVADYYCYSGMYFYPWSRPSIEYFSYLSLRAQLNLSLR